MSPHPPRSLLPLLAPLLLALACGDPVVNPSYEGEPLVTLEGQMTVSAGTTFKGNVRLAMAWYPTLVSGAESEPISNPSSIFTEDVVYESSFPVNYRFNLYRPPPTRAMVSLPEGYAGKGAVGILLAYEDRNTNRKLDTIPATGFPMDKVLGSSLVWTSAPAWMVIYVNAEQPAETGLKKGFNLVKIENATSSKVVPLSTPIPIKLFHGSYLDTLVCEASFSDSTVSEPCHLGLSAGDKTPVVDIFVEGSVTFSSTGADVDLSVRRNEVFLSDALVTLGGRQLQYVQERGTYRLAASDTTALPPNGTLELRVVANGKELVRSLPLPGDFDITSPAVGAHVKNGALIDGRWTASPGAREYLVSLETATEDTVGFVLTSDTGYPFETPGQTGTFILKTVALSHPEDNARMGLIDVMKVRTRTFIIDP